MRDKLALTLTATLGREEGRRSFLVVFKASDAVLSFYKYIKFKLTLCPPS